MRNAARELDDLEAALHFAFRVRKHLAMLAYDAPRDVVGVAIDQITKLE